MPGLSATPARRIDPTRIFTEHDHAAQHDQLPTPYAYNSNHRSKDPTQQPFREDVPLPTAAPRRRDSEPLKAYVDMAENTGGSRPGPGSRRRLFDGAWTKPNPSTAAAAGVSVQQQRLGNTRLNSKVF